MDDFNVSSLHESKNEWASRLINILTPLIIEGYKSIFNEALQLCKQNNEMDKYLMTFQNFISRVPKWNASIIEQEKKRINEKSGCGYLEDLITCVHIIQLKILTSIRAGNTQKKINISIPKLDDFIHKIYINVARKIYKNVYLFEVNIQPLQIQKNQRELEIIVQECILNTIRDSIPVETILKAYMDETIEEDVIEEIKEQILQQEAPTPLVNTQNEVYTKANTSTHLKFDDNDDYYDNNNNKLVVSAPKTIDRLEEISNIRAKQRQSLENSYDDQDDEKIRISNTELSLDSLDIQNIENTSSSFNEKIPDLLIDDIEVL